MATSTSSVTDTSAASLAALAGTSSTKKKDDASERFLTLLVAQMKNQDPMNPTDNAQVTSQMAQISTVTGIDKLNDTVSSLTSQMMQNQVIQGAGLVGHDVLLEGNKLPVTEGKGVAGFELASAADAVKVEVLSPSGRVIDTVNLGAQNTGRNGFEWTPPAGASTDGLTFRVTATSGAKPVTATPLMTDHVTAVSTSSDGLTVELTNSGSTPYSKIKMIS